MTNPKIRAWLAGALLASIAGVGGAEAAELLKPPEIWTDYDPDRGDFREEVVHQEVAGGVMTRRSYISAYVLGLEIRVFCIYRVKQGLVNAPGLLDVHGWMGQAAANQSFVDDGWAVMGFDYCGKTGNRAHYTKYPAGLRHGNMDDREGPVVHDSTPDRKSITDPKQTSLYLWYAIQRRVLSHLERQKEVDKSRLGATGYSYGGTLLWALGTDPRVKAIVPHFGIGWIEYYRNKRVWMYDNPRAAPPPKTPGEEIFLAGIAPEAHVPYITAATLYLNGSNDHHGGFERGLESFKRFSQGVPRAFAVQARGHHNTDKIEQNTKIWLNKHVVGAKDVFWPEHPKSEIRLGSGGVPELLVTPATPERVKSVEMYYARKNPVSFTRTWLDAPCVRNGAAWVGRMPVMNVDDYVFGYANITYDNTVVVSTGFNAAVPSELGAAKATDDRSEVVSGGGGLSDWTNMAALEGPKGVKAFRPTDNRAGSGTEKLNDPKWQAPPGSRLSLRFFCTEPQAMIVCADDRFDAELRIAASDNWQELVIGADQLIFRSDKRRAIKDWSEVGKLQFRAKEGSDITKILFAELKWIPAGKNEPKK